MERAQARQTRTLTARNTIGVFILIAMLFGLIGPGLVQAAQVSLQFTSNQAGTIAGSGFTTVLPGSSQNNGLLALNTAGTGTLQVTTTDGDLYSTSNNQSNALAVTFNGGQNFSAHVRILAPITWDDNYQGGGVLVGLNSDNYVKFIVGVDSDLRLEFLTEVGAAPQGSATDLPALGVNQINSHIDLWINGYPSSGTFKAFYRVDSDDPADIKAFNDYNNVGSRAGLDALLINGAYGGIVQTHTAASNAITIKYDRFVIDDPVIAGDGSGGEAPPISFTIDEIANTFTILNAPVYGGPYPEMNGFGPTSIALGPDGKLYVGSMTGRILIFKDSNPDPAIQAWQLDTELDLDGNPATDDYGIIDTIAESGNTNGTPPADLDCPPANAGSSDDLDGTRLLLGLTFDPASTPANPILYVSHSDPRWGKEGSEDGLWQGCYMNTRSGTISRLTGPNYEVNRLDVITGLPRSRENHATNLISFNPTGDWLYIPQGGNTNHGKPSGPFFYLEENYFSASIMRLKVSEFVDASDTINLNPLYSQTWSQVQNTLNTYAGKFEMLATGFRNPFDIVFHPNGKIWVIEGAGNPGFGPAADASSGCAGVPNYDPGDPGDEISELVQGGYAGHPNPSRGECTWGNGNGQGLGTPANYIAPTEIFQGYRSPTGAAVYNANSFNGAMLNNLVMAVWSGDPGVIRIPVNGTALGDPEKLTSLIAPTDLVIGAGGEIFVADQGGNKVVVLTPTAPASCPPAPSGPGGAGANDSDGDGYSDWDEVQNGTEHCSPASKPLDSDSDLLSDLLDSDDDNDGMPDLQDQLQIDASNGNNTSLPLALDFTPFVLWGGWKNSGLKGVQLSNQTQYMTATLNLSGFNSGGGSGVLAYTAVGGTNLGNKSTQVNALQVGFNGTQPFSATINVSEPFSTTSVLDRNHEVGGFFGLDGNNYLKLVLHKGGGEQPGIRAVLELNGTAQTVASRPLTFGGSIKNISLIIRGDPTRGLLVVDYQIYLLNGPQPAERLAILKTSDYPGLASFFTTGQAGTPGNPGANGANAGLLGSTDIVNPIPVSGALGFVFEYLYIAPMASFSSSPDELQLTLPVAPILANGSNSAIVQAEVLDELGLPVPDGTQVSFSTNLGSFSNGQASISAATLNGIASTQLRSASAGSATVNATVSGLNDTGTVQFTSDPSTAPASVTASGPGQPVATNDSEGALIQVTVLNNAGQPVPNGTQVTLNTTLGEFSNGQQSIVVTTTGGAASTRLRSGTAGTASITASAGGVNGTTTVEFILSNEPAPDKLVFVPRTVR